MTMAEINCSKIIRWGIIGCGNVTEIKSGPAYQKTKGFQLAAVMGRNESKAKDYAERHGVSKFYTDAENLINDDEIDAIYIATPPDSHKLYALQVSDSGKPCCIEKPLAPNYTDSLEIVEAFRKKKTPLFVAYYRRSLPRFQQIKAWLNAGAIGELRHVSWHLSSPANEIDVSQEYNWRTDQNIALGGYFDDLASHGLDLFAYLLGNFKSATGISVNQQGLYSANDAIAACWLHVNGTTGSGAWNFGSSQRKDKVEIFGSRGTLEFSIFGEAPLVLNTEHDRQEICIENPENIQLHHVMNMQAHFCGQAQHPSTGETATHTSWVMDKILGRSVS